MFDVGSKVKLRTFRSLANEFKSDCVGDVYVSNIWCFIADAPFYGNYAVCNSVYPNDTASVSTNAGQRLVVSTECFVPSRQEVTE